MPLKVLEFPLFSLLVYLVCRLSLCSSCRSMGIDGKCRRIIVCPVSTSSQWITLMSPNFRSMTMKSWESNFINCCQQKAYLVWKQIKRVKFLFFRGFRWLTFSSCSLKMPWTSELIRKKCWNIEGEADDKGLPQTSIFSDGGYIRLSAQWWSIFSPQTA